MKADENFFSFKYCTSRFSKIKYLDYNAYIVFKSQSQLVEK